MIRSSCKHSDTYLYTYNSSPDAAAGPNQRDGGQADNLLEPPRSLHSCNLRPNEARFHMVSAWSKVVVAGLSAGLVRFTAAAPHPVAMHTTSLQLVCIEWRTEHQVHMQQLPSAGTISVERTHHERSHAAW